MRKKKIEKKPIPKTIYTKMSRYDVRTPSGRLIKSFSNKGEAEKCAVKESENTGQDRYVSRRMTKIRRRR